MGAPAKSALIIDNPSLKKTKSLTSGEQTLLFPVSAKAKRKRLREAKPRRETGRDCSFLHRSKNFQTFPVENVKDQEPITPIGSWCIKIIQAFLSIQTVFVKSPFHLNVRFPQPFINFKCKIPTLRSPCYTLIYASLKKISHSGGGSHYKEALHPPALVRSNENSKCRSKGVRFNCHY